MWLFLAVAGYFLYAIVSILDKIILTRTIARPLIYTFYSTVVSILAVAALPWVGPLRGADWLFALLAGVIFSIGLFFLFTAMGAIDVSRIGPFNGALFTIFLYAFAFFFLGERLTPWQTAGIMILAAASMLLSQNARGGRGIERGFFFAIGSAFCFSVSQIATKYLYLRYPFLTVLVWNSIVTGTIGLLLLLHPLVRASFRRRERGAKSPLPLVALDKALAFAAVLLVQYAIAAGSVTIVGALSGMQFAFLFLLALALTHFAPRLFREAFTRRTLFIESVAIVLIVLGLMFIAI